MQNAECPTQGSVSAGQGLGSGRGLGAGRSFSFFPSNWVNGCPFFQHMWAKHSVFNSWQKGKFCSLIGERDYDYGVLKPSFDGYHLISVVLDLWRVLALIMRNSSHFHLKFSLRTFRDAKPRTPTPTPPVTIYSLGVNFQSSGEHFSSGKSLAAVSLKLWNKMMIMTFPSYEPAFHFSRLPSQRTPFKIRNEQAPGRSSLSVSIILSGV